jgi:hypothetical protein
MMMVSMRSVMNKSLRKEPKGNLRNKYQAERRLESNGGLNSFFGYPEEHCFKTFQSIKVRTK